MGVPYTFGTATTSIPLSNLDANFNTPVTIGNATVGLGNTVTTVGNLTLTNATISSGNVTVTTGIFGAGSNTAPSITTTGDTNTGIFFPAADTIAFTEGGVESMRIDSAGLVGIGCTPVSNLQINASSDVGVAMSNSSSVTSGNRGTISMFNSGTSTCGYIRFGAVTDNVGTDIQFANRPAGGSLTECMRIDSSGNLLVGTTSVVAKVTVQGNASANGLQVITPTVDYQTLGLHNTATSGDNLWAVFISDASSLRGSISYNRAGGLTAYNTTSDYRAKTVNGAVQNALSKVALLKPSTGRMNGATEDIDFFVAHELQEVVPSAVTGEKDAVNEDDTPKYQMVDKSALIPLLTAAIKEQQAIIESLTTRITALEGQ